MRNSRSLVVTRWFLAGALSAVALVGVNRAIGQQHISVHHSPTVNGWMIRQKQESPNVLKYTLLVENTEAKARSADLVIKLVRQEFKGNPASRVLRPGDIVRKELEEKRLSVQVAGKQTREIELSFSTRPEIAEKVSYQVTAEIDGKQLPVIPVPPRRDARA